MSTGFIVPKIDPKQSFANDYLKQLRKDIQINKRAYVDLQPRWIASQKLLYQNVTPSGLPDLVAEPFEITMNTAAEVSPHDIYDSVFAKLKKYCKDDTTCAQILGYFDENQISVLNNSLENIITNFRKEYGTKPTDKTFFANFVMRSIGDAVLPVTALGEAHAEMVHRKLETEAVERTRLDTERRDNQLALDAAQQAADQAILLDQGAVVAAQEAAAQDEHDARVQAAQDLLDEEQARTARNLMDAIVKIQLIQKTRTKTRKEEEQKAKDLRAAEIEERRLQDEADRLKEERRQLHGPGAVSKIASVYRGHLARSRVATQMEKSQAAYEEDQRQSQAAYDEEQRQKVKEKFRSQLPARPIVRGDTYEDFVDFFIQNPTALKASWDIGVPKTGGRTGLHSVRNRTNGKPCSLASLRDQRDEFLSQQASSPSAGPPSANANSVSATATGAVTSGNGLRYGRHIYGRGKSEAQNLTKYKQINKFLVDMQRLKNDNILCVKYASTMSLHPILKTVRVSNVAKTVLLGIIADHFIESEYRKLNETDKRIVNKFVKYCHLDYPIEDTSQEEQEKYDILLGEYNSGNDSPQVKAELKKFVCMALADNKIPKYQGMHLLYELSL